MNLGTRGGKARLLGPSESPAFCAVWEAKSAAGLTKEMTGSREHSARVFAWGQAEARERCAKLCEALGRGFARDEVSAQECADAIRATPKDKP